jgi:L-alanine-DL-glutamate epimerase-like enolase superfamily enzyme
MKIAAIECFPLRPKVQKEAWTDDEYVWPSVLPCFIVKVSAEDGSYGVGEATSQVWYLGETAEQIAANIKLYDGALRGKDPANFALCHQLMEATVGGGMPGGRTARSGVDMALYDLVGKARGVPVHALLGGAYRTSFEQLTNLYHKTPEAMAEGCREYVGRGFKGLKIKVGDVLLAKGWNRDNLESELAKLQAALEVTPRNVYIDADANQGWRSAQWTVSVLQRFARYDNLSMEQPLPYADLEGAAFVRAHSRVPVIMDESAWSPEAVMQLIRMQAADRIVLKLNRVGGLLPGLQIITICEAAGVGVSVDTNPYTLLGDTAVCHIAAVARTPYPVDCEGHISFLSFGENSPFSGGITFRDGRAWLPDAPGLGVEVDWKRVEALTKEAAQA